MHNHPPQYPRSITSLRSSYYIDTSETASRDITSFREWAANFGVQTIDLELIPNNENDVAVITNQELPAESAIACTPNSLILTSSVAASELSTNSAASTLDTADQPAFHLFAKILYEYELGQESPWYAWLNSMPKYYSNGASMTNFCFGCLPPYAAGLALSEKNRLKEFAAALSSLSFISEETKCNPEVLRWAYNVVYTRYFENEGELCLVPMMDYFNHGGVNANAYVMFDEEGNCYAYSTTDVGAGQPLEICYGDPTNPSNLLARYGFLDESSSATFCKYIISNPTYEHYNLGYPSQTVFYNDGSISQQVWDLVLYEELAKVSPAEQAGFYQACITGDAVTKQGHHYQYWEQSWGALQKHVKFLVDELDDLEIGLSTKMHLGQDADLHPRLPLLMRHNEFVKDTIESVEKNLDNMFS